MIIISIIISLFKVGVPNRLRLTNVNGFVAMVKNTAILKDNKANVRKVKLTKRHLYLFLKAPNFHFCMPFSIASLQSQDFDSLLPSAIRKIVAIPVSMRIQ